MSYQHQRYLFRKITWAVLATFLFCVTVLFSWNSFAEHLFQLPAIQFKQALGLVLFTGSLAYLVRLVFRFEWYEWRK